MAAVRELPASCGLVRLIAVDRHAGSGKSTLSAQLADALNGAPLLHLADLASHQEMFRLDPAAVPSSVRDTRCFGAPSDRASDPLSS